MSTFGASLSRVLPLQRGRVACRARFTREVVRMSAGVHSAAEIGAFVDSAGCRPNLVQGSGELERVWNIAKQHRRCRSDRAPLAFRGSMS